MKNDENPKRQNKLFTYNEYQTYALGLHDFRAEDRELPTIKTILEARLEYPWMFESSNQRYSRRCAYYFDSSTARIASGGWKFKIDMDSKDLRKIPNDFGRGSAKIIVDYDSNKGVEFDANEGFYAPMKKKEFLEHKLWWVLLGGKLSKNGKKIANKEVASKMARLAHEVYDIEGCRDAFSFTIPHPEVYVRGELSELGLNPFVYDVTGWDPRFQDETRFIYDCTKEVRGEKNDNK